MHNFCHNLNHPGSVDSSPIYCNPLLFALSAVDDNRTAVLRKAKDTVLGIFLAFESSELSKC